MRRLCFRSAVVGLMLSGCGFVNKTTNPSRHGSQLNYGSLKIDTRFSRSIGMIEGDIGTGSGFVVGQTEDEYIILTAQHVVADEAENLSIGFALKQYDELAMFPIQTLLDENGEAFMEFKNFLGEAANDIDVIPEQDYALLTLDKKELGGEKLDVLPVSFDLPPTDKEFVTEVIGYPGDIRSAGIPSLTETGLIKAVGVGTLLSVEEVKPTEVKRPLGAEDADTELDINEALGLRSVKIGPASKAKADLLQSTAAVYAGHSGSPVFARKDDGSLVVIGIASASASEVSEGIQVGSDYSVAELSGGVFDVRAPLLYKLPNKIKEMSFWNKVALDPASLQPVGKIGLTRAEMSLTRLDSLSGIEYEIILENPLPEESTKIYLNGRISEYFRKFSSNANKIIFFDHRISVEDFGDSHALTIEFVSTDGRISSVFCDLEPSRETGSLLDNGYSVPLICK